MASRVVFNRGALDDLIDSPIGMAALDLERRLIRVQNDAKRRCPVDTGRLRNSITHEIVAGRDLVGRVGTNVTYAAAVHEGWTRTTRRGVFTRLGRPFLRDALSAGGG